MELRATVPSVTTTLGRMMSKDAFKNDVQFLISFALGLRLFPSIRGLHKTALVMKTSERINPICLSRTSKLSPDRSPWKGTPVLPAPNLPGASAIKNMLASNEPLAELKIAVSSARLGHIRQAAAFFSNLRKLLLALN